MAREPERVPLYFADVAAFARYYRVSTEVAEHRIRRLVQLGHLAPARYLSPPPGHLGPLLDDGPAPGWEVCYPLPPPRAAP